MLVYLHKSLRVGATLVAMALGQLYCSAANAVAFDSASEVLNWLSTHIISQNYSTGPWTLNSALDYVSYRSIYDYNYGGGDVYGSDPENFVFKNFYLPGLDLSASITGENGQYQINLDVSGIHRINSGYKSEYTASYDGKWARIFPLYYEEGEADYNPPTECAQLQVEDKYYAYVIPGEQVDTYSIPVKTDWRGIDVAGLRGKASDKGLIIAIYDDADCTILSDVKTFIQGDFSALKEALATAEDIDRNGNVIRRYKLNYQINGMSFDFYNLNCLGNSIALNGGTSDQYSTLTWDYDNQAVYFNGKCPDNSTEIYTYSTFNNSTDFKFEGYTTKSQLLGIEDASSDVKAYWFSYTAPKYTTITKVSEETNYFKTTGLEAKNLETFGFYGASGGRIDHNHSVTRCPWVTNDGDRLTGSQGVDFYLYKYGLAKYANSDSSDSYSLEKGEIEYIEWYSRTNLYNIDLGAGYKDLTSSETLDCTLNVDLEIDAFGSNSSNIYVAGKIKPVANTQFVDHYELCVLPGKLTSVLDFPQEDVPSAVSDDDDVTTVHFTNYQFGTYGHPSGVDIADSTYDISINEPAMAAVDDDDDSSASDEISFVKLISKPAEWAALENGDATNYSFYVRAIYKSEYYDEAGGVDQGLSPTYHDITSPTGITTALKSIDTDDSAVVTTAQGEINIFGEVAHVAVYGVSGALVYSGNATSIAVSSGIYIVKLDDKIIKVAVR